MRDKAGRNLGSRAQKTRQRFLEATAKLLAERSILDISVTDIARELDSASSLFYHYFSDVEDAARELALDASREVTAMLPLVAGSWEGDEGLNRARALAEAYLEHWQRNHGVLLLRNQAADRGDRSFLAIRKQALQPLTNTLAGLIAASQRDGRIAQDLHPYLAAAALASMLEKLAADARSLSYYDADRDDLVATCARMIYTTVTGIR